jgi:hypothetical protein
MRNLSSSIRTLELPKKYSNRILNALANHFIKLKNSGFSHGGHQAAQSDLVDSINIASVLSLTGEELARIKQMGRKSAHELKTTLKKHGFEVNRTWDIYCD